MSCPFCRSKSTQVTNSRVRKKGTQVWRRRQCGSCKNIWTTHESVDLSSSHNVKRRDGSVEPFSRDELFVSIKDSLSHRKTAVADATHLTDTVLIKILALKTKQTDSSKLVDLIYHVLRRFDKTAAAVYKASRRDD